MTWNNTKRIKRRSENRRQHHEDNINNAATPRRALWAACGWLVSEAWQAGLIDEAMEWVLTKVHEIREEAKETDDHHDYAA